MGYEGTPRLVDANRLQGRDISTLAPANLEDLKWDSGIAKWKPRADTGGPGGSAWGDITGTLSDQFDLQAALDAAGQPFLSANTARVDPSGDDDTGEVGDLQKPFLTVQGAINAFVDHPEVTFPLIDIGNNHFTEDLIIDATFTAGNIAYLGSHNASNSVAFASLTHTGTGALTIYSNGASLGNITSSTNSTLVIEPYHCYCGNVTITGSGSLLVVTDLSRGTVGDVDVDSGTITLAGLSGVGMIVSGGPLITIESCGLEGFNDPPSINAPGATVNATNSILNNITISPGTLNLIDSRFAGTCDVTPVYADVLLSNKIRDNSGMLSVDANARKLFATDGTTQKAFWGDPTGPFDINASLLVLGDLKVGTNDPTFNLDGVTGDIELYTGGIYLDVGGFNGDGTGITGDVSHFGNPSGSALQVLRRNAANNGFEFATPSAGGSVATDTIFDAKGDLAVGTGADTAAKLTVGANDTIAIADSTQTTGIRWGTPASVRTALSLVTGTNIVAFNGALGTPTSGTGTNLTGIPEGGLSLTDITTNNVSTTKHGFTPKLPNDATKYLDGTGAFTVPSSSGAGLGANTFTGSQTISVAGAASTPAAYLTGTWLTGGTGTTNFPHLFLQATGTTASTTWSTAGTAFGANAVTGFTGNLIDLQLAGASKFSVTSAGVLTTAGNLTTNGTFLSIGGSGGALNWSSSSRITAPADGRILFRNNAGTGFTRLDLFADTTSGAAIGFDAVNGITLQSGAGSATWNDGSTANSGTVANRYMFGIAAPTLTSTGTSVTDTVASTVYIGGAPTASTNTTIGGTPYALNVAAGPSNFGGVVIMKGYTVATLPSTAATGKVQGARAFVTDALAPAFLATVVGGGAIVSPVFYDGTNWVAE